MSISVRMPKEITDYQEKIIFGLSLRQLLCFSLATVLSLATFFMGTQLLHLPADPVEYVIILLTIPILAVGFIKKNGLTFEKYFILFLRHHFGCNRLPAKTVLVADLPDQLLGKKKGQDEQTLCMAKLTWAQKRQAKRLAEAESIFIPTKKTRAASRARLRQEIKSARRDYQRAKQALACPAKKPGRAPVRSRICGLSATV